MIVLPISANEINEIINPLIVKLIKKNTDYGSSFDDLMDVFGNLAFVIRLVDKVNRLQSITKNKETLVQDESFQDTVDDIIGYCILYKRWLHENRL